jgi:hypothetical protein
MRTTWDFASSECLTFGWGASVLLDSRLARFDRRRIMVITDERLVSAGLVRHVTANVSSKRAVEVFAGGQPEPSTSSRRCSIRTAARRSSTSDLTKFQDPSPFSFAFRLPRERAARSRMRRCWATR